mmetsp:Transcript_23281/g.55725  ORF Transcript_23281/g.55725 Transcript_23281/m.55725 type:complete len:214 (-) Transcript_23281:561-1202(-)
MRRSLRPKQLCPLSRSPREAKAPRRSRSRGGLAGRPARERSPWGFCPPRPARAGPRPRARAVPPPRWPPGSASGPRSRGTARPSRSPRSQGRRPRRRGHGPRRSSCSQQRSPPHSRPPPQLGGHQRPQSRRQASRGPARRLPPSKDRNPRRWSSSRPLSSRSRPRCQQRILLGRRAREPRKPGALPRSHPQSRWGKAPARRHQRPDRARSPAR